VLGDRGGAEPAAEQRRHHAEDRHALPDAAHHLPERVGEPDRDAEDEGERQEVGEARRVLERVGTVGVEEAAAVRPQLLDDLLRGDGAARDDLVRR
jgi:hypothetical protein